MTLTARSLALAVLIVFGLWWFFGLIPATDDSGKADANRRPGDEPSEPEGGPGRRTRPGNSLRFRTDKAILMVGKDSLQAKLTQSPAQRGFAWRGRRLAVDKATVQLFEGEASKPLWRARSQDGRTLEFSARVGRTGYFLAIERDKYNQTKTHEQSHEIRRLNLETGRWLKSIELAVENILAPPFLVASDDRLAVASLQGLQSNLTTKITDYHVACFREDTIAPIWARDFAVTESRGYDGVYVRGISAPRYAFGGAKSLTWVGDRLLVCVEAIQPILALNADTGTTLWDLDRIWEFARGFHGPSTYAHFVGRFGVDETFEPMDAETKESLRAEFHRRHTGSVVGGPAVLPLGFERGFDSHSIFFAVAFESREEYSGHFAQCRIYEVDDRGTPISTVNLPQVLDGGSFRVTDDGVVWAGHNDCIVKILPSVSGRLGYFPGSSTDGTTRLDWLRQLRSEERKGWLGAGPSRAPTAFGRRIAIRQATGGVVIERRDSVYRFPLVAVDLRTGTVEEIILSLPFEGRMPKPTFNYQSRFDGFDTAAPYKVGVTHLDLSGSRLTITLSGEDLEAETISFELADAAFFATLFEPKARVDYSSRIAALGGIDQRDEQGRTPLHVAVGGRDAGWVRALLAAGADHRMLTKAGYTVLMVAAENGTAEIVESLIAHGVDAGARVAYHGMQSPLALAARSYRGSKPRARALIEAGAAVDEATARGQTPLMAAASVGNLDTIELLSMPARISIWRTTTARRP